MELSWDLDQIIRFNKVSYHIPVSSLFKVFDYVFLSFFFLPKEKQKLQKYSAVWEKSVGKPLTLLAVKKSLFSQVQKQKVKVALQVPPYSKEVEISKVPEATRTDPGQAQIHIHPLSHLHPQWMSKDHQESRR